MKCNFLILLFELLKLAFAEIIYIENNSSFISTLKTIGGAAKVLPGTIIQFRAGINKKSQWVSGLKGNSTHHIVIKGGPGVIVEEGIAVEGSEYIDLLGPFEIRNLTQGALWGGNGLTTVDCQHCLVEGFYIHHVYRNCIRAGGTDVIVRNNIVHDCVIMNLGNNMTNKGGWGQALMIGVDHSDPSGLALGKNILAENNTVYDSWGEGIDLLYCDTCICRNNTIRNVFSVLLYADNSRNLIIENNFLSTNTDLFNGGNHTRRPNAFGVSRESHGKVNATNITIRNNLVVNAQNGVMNIGLEGYYSGLKVVHNTFYNLSSLGMQFPGCKVPSLVSNNEVSNNLFSGGANFKNEIEKSSFKVFANGWLNESGIWHIMDDTKGNASFWIKKSMREVLFPKGDGCFKFECFLPRCLENIPKDDKYGNLIIGKGMKSENSNGLDFFGRKRDPNHPSLGFSESCTIPDNWINKGDEKNKNTEEGMSTSVVIILVIVISLVVICALFFVYKYFLSSILFKGKKEMNDIEGAIIS